MQEVAVLGLMVAGSAVLLIFVGIALVVHWDRAYRLRGSQASRPELKDALVVLTMGTLLMLAGVAGAGWAAAESRRWTFHFYAALIPNGTGSALVTLPTLADEGLLSDLQTSPPRTAFSFVEIRDGPALNITVTGPAWLNATDTGMNSGWADQTMPCEEARSCHVEIAVSVVSGNVASVHVRLSVGMARSCWSRYWWVDAEVLPGAALYPAERRGIVC